MPPKKRQSSSSHTEGRSSETLERVRSASVCSFVTDFTTFCMEEMSPYIPQVEIIGLEKSRLIIPKSSSLAGSRSASQTTSLGSHLSISAATSVREEEKPKVRLKYDNPEKRDNLRMIEMNGIPVEMGLLNAIGRCLPLAPSLTILKFQECKLHSQDVVRLASILAGTCFVKELYLDGNPNTNMAFDCLLQLETRIQHLSLSMCRINDDGVMLLATELSYKEIPTQILQSLNLTHNQITCVGAQYLANALRSNRTLISLSLAGNRISDVGAISLAEVFKKFALWHEECVIKRQKNFSRILERNTLIEKLNIGVKVPNPVPKSGKEAGAKVIPKKPRSTGKEHKRGSHEKTGSLAQESSNMSQSSKRISKTISVTSTTEQKRLEQLVEQEMEVDTYPYLHEVTAEGGSLWCAGNFKLAHLNLAYNRIGLLGTVAFHEAVMYQDKILHNTRNGLLHLVLQGNPIPVTCLELKELLETTNNRFHQYTDKINTNQEESHRSSLTLRRRSSSKKTSTPAL